jgi:hypothetical protein
MSFIEIKPGKNKIRGDIIDKIRISFSNLKKTKKNSSKYILTIYIGKTIADSLGINVGEKVVFSYEDTNKRIWLITKSNTDSGFTLCKQSEKNDVSFKIQLTWPNGIFTPKDDDLYIRNVKHDFFKGGVRIYA